jgi:hypothetical protein
LPEGKHAVKIGNDPFSSDEFDFAFSFAGEDRKTVEKIYDKLTADGLHIFYDYAYQAQLVGRDLYTGLRDLYRNKGKYVVCFISEHYAKKIWTNLEFTAIKERLMTTFFAGDFLIPILIGKASMLEDIPSFIGFYRHRSVEETVEMLKEKISSFIMEDHFINNINSCISHICDQIYHRLSRRNVDVTLVNTNELKIRGPRDIFSLYFSSDPIAQMPCILISREDHCGKTFLKETFPVFIITWNKNEHLLFSVYDFDSITNAMIENRTFYDVVNYLCSYAERCLGGCHGQP